MYITVKHANQNTVNREFWLDDFRVGRSSWSSKGLWLWGVISTYLLMLIILFELWMVQCIENIMFLSICLIASINSLRNSGHHIYLFKLTSSVSWKKIVHSCFKIPPILPPKILIVVPSDHTTVATSGADTADPSEEQDFTLGFIWVRVVQSLVFSVGFYRSLFGLFTLSLLHDLSSNLRLLIRPLLFSNIKIFSEFSFVILCFSLDELHVTKRN